MMNKKVTDGRDFLGNFAPQFAAINDDVLFGQVWNKDNVLSDKTRSMITIAALMGAGIIDESLESHLKTGKENGITKEEIVDIITHLAFYTGWPKAWAVFAKAMPLYQDQDEKEVIFGKGKEINDPKHFNGSVYVNEILDFNYPMLVDQVTFKPGVRNNWHIHQAGQVLLVTEGQGWYQEAGKPARFLKVGDIVKIPAQVKHWHGATQDSWFSHLALEDWSKGEPEWLEAVDDKEYDQLRR